MTQPISLDAYRAARATQPDPLPEVDALSIACLRADWLLALEAAGGDPWLAHLWATRQLCDDLAGHDDPVPALGVVSDAIVDALCEVGRRVR